MFPRNSRNPENTENYCFRQSVKTLINITFWEVFSGPKRKKRTFPVSGAKKWKSALFCSPEHFFHSSHPKNEKVEKRIIRFWTLGALWQLECVYIYVSWEVRRGTFSQKLNLCVFSILERKRWKSAPKTWNSAPKRRIPHFSAISRKWPQNTYKILVS